MVDRKPAGAPYGLSGNRLVFINWLYISPGQFAWMDDNGKNVTVAGSEGPWEAHFKKWDSPYGIRLAAQPAERKGPLLEPEKPWEGKGVRIDTFIYDQGIYRGWGSCSPAEGGTFFCYFESKDGIHWERPEVGLIEYKGSKKNNILNIPPGTVFVDPSSPPSERYKRVTEFTISREEYNSFRERYPDRWEPRADRLDAGLIFAIKGAVSPDGLNWTMLPEPLVVEHSDTQVVAYYDEKLHKYVMYTRNYMIGERSEQAQDTSFRPWWDTGRRSIGRTESSDFRQFPLSEVILEPNPSMMPSDVLYTNCRTVIPGAPDHQLMFPTIWHTNDDTTSITMASSHDGKVWNYLPGPPVFETTPFGEWDGGSVFAHPNLIELPDSSFALPYTGYLFPHKYPRGRWRYNPGMAVWPKGRLIALEAPERGEFATIAIIPPGKKLFINALTQRAGSITMEVADIDGKPLPGRSFEDSIPVIGDHQKQQVTWKEHNDIGHSQGEGIIFRFRIEKAKIFALDFD